MDATQRCYRDTLRMAEAYRAAGREAEAKRYDKQAEMWKKKLEKRTK